MDAKYLIIITSHYGDRKIEVLENEDIKLKFEEVVDKIENDPLSSATIVKIWNIGKEKYENEYFFDRLHSIMNRDHDRYLDHKFDKNYDPNDTDGKLFP